MADSISEQEASVCKQEESISDSADQEKDNDIDTELAFVEESLQNLGWSWIQSRPSSDIWGKMLGVEPLTLSISANDAGFSVYKGSALDLPPSFGRDVGFREVSQQGLRSKIKDMMLAKVWREWDVLRLATVENTTVYLDFHIRGCALLVVLHIYQHFSRSLPSWLHCMASKIPIEYHGEMAKATWLSKCLSRAVALEHGAIAMSWLDVVQHCRQDASMVDNLHHRMRLDCPETTGIESGTGIEHGKMDASLPQIS